MCFFTKIILTMLILSLANIGLIGLLCFKKRSPLKYLLLFSVCCACCSLVLASFSPYGYCYLRFQRDLLRICLIFITSLLLLISPVTQNFSSRSVTSLYISLIILGLFSFLIFSTTNFLILYTTYEASLLPIMFCILK